MDFVTVLASVAGRLPSILVEVVAIVLALARWQRHPTVSMFVVVGMTIQLLVGVAASVLPFAMVRAGVQGSQMSLYYIPLTVLGALGGGLMVAAVFSGRSAQGTEEPTRRW